MADLSILALTVFTFQNNTQIAINIHLLEIFALLLVFSYQFTAKCLSLPPPLLDGAISKPLVAILSKGKEKLFLLLPFFTILSFFFAKTDFCFVTVKNCKESSEA